MRHTKEHAKALRAATPMKRAGKDAQSRETELTDEAKARLHLARKAPLSTYVEL